MKINRYLKISEAAKFLGVCTATLRNWEKNGILKPFRGPFGSKSKYRLYRIEDCENLLKQVQKPIEHDNKQS